MIDWIKKYSKWVTIFVLGAALIAVYKTFNSLDMLKSITGMIVNAAKPFILAIVIAYLLNIPAKNLKELINRKSKSEFLKKHKEAISIAIVYIVFIIILIVILWAILPVLFNNIIDMVRSLPHIAEDVINWINNLDIIKRNGVSINVADIQATITHWVDSLNATVLGKYAQGILSVTSGIMTITSSIINIFIAFIASIYMLIDKEILIRGLKRYVLLFTNNDKMENLIDHFASVNEIFTQYIYSRLICCLIMAITCTVILLIMGEKYAVLLGVFIGFMDIIPYFGSIISWVVSALLMTVSGGIFHAIWCSIAMLVMQQIDGNLLAPKIMGSRLEVRPLTIIIAVSVGGSLFGFIGMLISVPVVAILKLSTMEIVKEREAQIANNKEENSGEQE